MSLTFAVDEVTMSLMALTLVLGVALGMKSSSPDTPYSRVTNQSEVSKIRNKNESAVYRSRLAYSGVKTSHENLKTLHEVFLRGAEVSQSEPCLGTKGPSGSYGWTTYKEIVERARNFGSGLISLGLKPGQETRVGLVLKNQSEWIITDLACFAFSMVSVGISDQSSSSDLEKIVKEAKLSAVVCLPERVAELEALSATCGHPFKVISTEKSQKEASDFQQVEALGKSNPAALVPPASTAVATIAYNKGPSKGVVLTHMNLLTSLSAILTSQASNLTLRKTDVYLSQFSPIHPFERVYIYATFAVGGSVGFSTDPSKLFDDLKLVKPTFTTSATRTLDLLVLRIQRTINQSGFFKKGLFNTVFESKRKSLRTGVLSRSSLWDRLIFVYIREIFGGQLKFLATVGNPAYAESTDFLRISLGCNIFEGYELAEAAGFVSMTLSGDYNTGHVGPPTTCTEIKLLEIPELSLYPTDSVGPRGEICIRGPNVSQEYINDPETTKAAKLEGDWIRTGELGMFLANRALKVIGSKANAVKLGDDDVIFLDQLEHIYTKSPYVNEIAIRMKESTKALDALVVPNAEVLLDWASKNGVSGDVSALCNSDKVAAELFMSLRQVAEQNGLRPVEQISAVQLDPVPFSQRGLLTPDMRLKRAQVDSLFRQ